MPIAHNNDAVDIPHSISEAFRARPFIPFLELAALLGMNKTTLRNHIRAGDLPWRQKGLGTKAPRKVFALADVAVLLRNMQRKSDREFGRQWHVQRDSGAILRFSERTSSDGKKPTIGATNSMSEGNPSLGRATPQTSKKPNGSPLSSRRKKKSKRARSLMPD